MNLTAAGGDARPNMRKSVLEEGRFSSQNFMAAQKQANTVKSYESKIRQLISFLKTSPTYAAKIDSSKEDIYEQVDLPLGISCLSDFFEKYAYKDRSENSSSLTLISRSGASAYRSAIIHLYDTRKVRIPDSERDFFLKFLKGFNNVLAERKNLGQQESREGSDFLRVKDYFFLCDLAFTGKHMAPSGADDELCLMAHSFLTLQWNLIQRAQTIGDLCYEGFEVNGDHFVVMIDKMKNDTTGDRQYPRAIHANITTPEVCPILALALYFFSTFTIFNVGSSNHRIYRNGSARFSEWLCRILEQSENSFDADIEDTITEGQKRQTGSHSVRKGAYTFLQTILEGPQGGPTQQRAGWVSGGNQAVIFNMSTVII